MKILPVRLITRSAVAAALILGSLLAADNARAGQPTPNPKSKTCVPAATDGTSGTYPAKKSADCTKLKVVTVWVTTDPLIGGAFEPSNITIKRGTKVSWIWKAGSHNLAPFHMAIESVGFRFSKTFPKVGKYAYMCQVHPGQNGLIIVR
jgi:plastocyanin